MNATLYQRKRKTPKGSRPPIKHFEIVHNNTPYTLEDVQSFCRYGGFMNPWRQRYVDVYQPPWEFIRDHPEKTIITVETNHVTDQIWIYSVPFSIYQNRITNADWSIHR